MLWCNVSPTLGVFLEAEDNCKMRNTVVYTVEYIERLGRKRRNMKEKTLWVFSI